MAITCRIAAKQEHRPVPTSRRRDVPLYGVGHHLPGRGQPHRVAGAHVATPGRSVAWAASTITCRIAARWRRTATSSRATSRRRGTGPSPAGSRPGSPRHPRASVTTPGRSVGWVAMGHHLPDRGQAAMALNTPPRARVATPGRSVGCVAMGQHLPDRGQAAAHTPRPVPTSRRRGVAWAAMAIPCRIAAASWLVAMVVRHCPVPASRRRGLSVEWVAMGHHLPVAAERSSPPSPRAHIATPGRSVGGGGQPLPDRGQVATHAGRDHHHHRPVPTSRRRAVPLRE
jgi:hypothetical protein